MSNIINYRTMDKIIVEQKYFLSNDILLSLFSHLDAQSLLESMLVCSNWKNLILEYQTCLWKNLVYRDFGINGNYFNTTSTRQQNTIHSFNENSNSSYLLSDNTTNYQSSPLNTFDLQYEDSLNRHDKNVKAATQLSWLNVYKVQFNILNGKFIFKNGHEDGFTISSSETYANHNTHPQYTIQESEMTKLDLNPSTNTNHLFSWSAHPEMTYMTAVDETTKMICWVDQDNLIDINLSSLSIKRIRAPASQNTVQNNHLPQFTLRGHHEPICLILGNNEGTLYSFDESSTIIVWDLKTKNKERSIYAEPHSGFILSMNVYGRTIITGGTLGKVTVWDANDGSVIFSVSIHDTFLNQLPSTSSLNVAIWKNLAAFCLFDGSIFVYDIDKSNLIRYFHIKDALYYHHQQQHGNSNSIKITRDGTLLDKYENHCTHDEHNDDDDSNMSEFFTSSANEFEQSRENEIEREQIYSLNKIFTENMPPNLLGIVGSVSKKQESVIFNRDLVVDSTEQWIVPITFSLNGHTLLSSGPNWNEVIVWDIWKGEFKYILSESMTLNHSIKETSISPFNELKFAELTFVNGGSMIYGSVSNPSNQDIHRILVWEFNQKTSRTYTKHFKKVNLFSQSVFQQPVGARMFEHDSFQVDQLNADNEERLTISVWICEEIIPC